MDKGGCERCGSIWGKDVDLIGGVPATLCIPCRRAFSAHLYTQHEWGVYDASVALMTLANRPTSRMSEADAEKAVFEYAIARRALADISTTWIEDERAKHLESKALRGGSNMTQTRRYRWFVVVALLCAVLALTSCAFLEKRSSLRTAVDTYATTLSVLASYRTAGMLSDEAVERIDIARVLVRQALDDWREALETDKSPSRAIWNFTEAMTLLIEERVLAAEGGG